MKKIFMILALLFSLSATSQIKKEWLSNHKEAMSIAETKAQHILVFAFDTTNSETYKLLQAELFGSEDFQDLQSNFIFLKLDLNSDTYNQRLATHYTGVKSIPALALIDKKGNRIGSSLSSITAENIQKFISFLKDSK